ncbi:hypothetical protein NWO25_16245 [Enterococcus lactis]|nr:hypothetical protein [Enterococcus lactis]
MGESGNRTRSPIDPINGNRANGLATGKTTDSQKSNERPFRRFRRQVEKPPSSGDDKVNQNNNMQQSNNPECISEGNPTNTQR